MYVDKSSHMIKKPWGLKSYVQSFGISMQLLTPYESMMHMGPEVYQLCPNV